MSLPAISFSGEAISLTPTQVCSGTIPKRWFDPFGQILAGPAFGEEAILTAEIDLRNIARGKFDFDVTGHYSRPDIFRLTVDERRQAPVTVIPSTREHDAN